MQLEVDKSQKEADIQIRNGEVAALQKEQDALNLTVSQLENQKAEAQKRLDELDDKVQTNVHYFHVLTNLIDFISIPCSLQFMKYMHFTLAIPGH